MKEFKNIIILLLLIFLIGGFTVGQQALDLICQAIVGFFPIIKIAGTKAIENYFTSAYFIVGIIIAVLAAVGVGLSIKKRKVLYIIVSLVLEVISLISIISNISN